MRIGNGELRITNIQLGITNYLWDIKSVKIRLIRVIRVPFLEGLKVE